MSFGVRGTGCGESVCKGTGQTHFVGEPVLEAVRGCIMVASYGGSKTAKGGRTRPLGACGTRVAAGRGVTFSFTKDRPHIATA